MKDNNLPIDETTNIRENGEDEEFYIKKKRMIYIQVKKKVNLQRIMKKILLIIMIKVIVTEIAVEIQMMIVNLKRIKG